MCVCVCLYVYIYVCMCVYIDIRTHTPKVYHRVVVGGGHCECNCLLRCLWHNNTRQLCPTAVISTAYTSGTTHCVGDTHKFNPVLGTTGYMVHGTMICVNVSVFVHVSLSGG